MRRTPLALVPLVLAALLVLVAGYPAGVAQVGTPVASPSAAPFASPAATPQADLAGVMPLPLTEARRAEFEAYVADAMNRLGVPGAAVAVVQGGAVAFLQGFGVRGPDPDPGFGQGVEVVQRASGDESAVVDDDDVVDGLGDFAQCVAGQEYGAAVGGEAPQQRAQP